MESKKLKVESNGEEVVGKKKSKPEFVFATYLIITPIKKGDKVEWYLKVPKKWEELFVNTFIRDTKHPYVKFFAVENEKRLSYKRQKERR